MPVCVINFILKAFKTICLHFSFKNALISYNYFISILTVGRILRNNYLTQWPTHVARIENIFMYFLRLGNNEGKIYFSCLNLKNCNTYTPQISENKYLNLETLLIAVSTDP